MKNEKPDMSAVVCDEFVRVRVSQTLKRRFTETAVAQGRNPSEAFREAMAEWVSRSAQQHA